MLDQLASRVGEVLKSELAAVQTRNGVFHRVRVKLDSMKPLTRFTSLVLEGRNRVYLQVKYEKMPKHCEYCGYMGHTYLECGTGEHEEKDRHFGPWMLSEEAFWKPGTPGARVRSEARNFEGNRASEPAMGRGGGRVGRGGRGAGGRSVCRWVAKTASTRRKRDSEEAGLGSEPLDDLNDTASSPLKPHEEGGHDA